MPLAGTEVAPSRGHNWGVNVILTRNALLDDPAKAAAIADFVRRAVAFYNWQGANPDAWIRASYVKLEGLTFEQGKWLEDAAGHGAYYPIDAKSIQVFQQISDGLFATGALKQKIDIAPYVDGRFNAIIAWQNNADGVIPALLSSRTPRLAELTSDPRPAAT